jgi:hypothetical protein
MKETISARTESENKEKLRRESQLRGHSLSEAVDFALTLGIPEYLRQFPVKFRPVSTKKSEVPI